MGNKLPDISQLLQQESLLRDLTVKEGKLLGSHPQGYRVFLSELEEGVVSIHVQREKTCQGGYLPFSLDLPEGTKKVMYAEIRACEPL